MKNKIFMGIKILVVVCMAVLSFVLFNSINSLDMIPNKYLYLLIGV